MAKLLANVIFKGNIVTLTGLHIGGSRDAMEIGGVDSPVLRDPATKVPYIPGSTLKGKMRMLLEFAEGRVNIKKNKKGEFEGKPCDCGKCMVCHIFGNPAESNRNIGPTRLVVRDAYPTKETIKMWESIDSELLYTEYKGENTIDRLTSAAMPRFFERVVPESKFNFELVYSIFDFEQSDDVQNIKYLIQALQMLEHSAIGGHGSRGYGKITIKIADPMIFTMSDYQTGKAILSEPKEEDLKPISQINTDTIISELTTRLK